MAEVRSTILRIDVQGNKELERLQANFDRSRRELKALNRAEREGTKTAAQINRERARANVELVKNRNALNDQRAAILKNNNALRKNSGFVAGVRKGVGQWATSMIGVTAAIAGVTRLLGSAVKIITDFEKANSQLAAVTRASTEEMTRFKDQAKELGSSTSFTASQVAELQISFARLGFPTQDILQMTEATLAGAKALGSDLGEQAALTGALIKQFGLDAAEAGRVNDVLAESAASSALDFQKLSTALPIVGATANAAGVDIERTTALLGTLSDRGIDASTSGTALRNVFLELSKQGLTFDEAMAKINSATDKNATAMDLFGKRGATVGVILAGTGDSVDKLEEKLNNAEGAARLMAQTMADNVTGDVTKAESAWEGFILSIEDGSGVIGGLTREIIQLGTSYLQMVAALNNGDIEAASQVWLNQIGVVSSEVVELETATGKLVLSQQDLLKAAQNNEAVFLELSNQFKEGTIDAAKYQKGVELLAGGWQQLTEEQKKAKEASDELAAKQAAESLEVKRQEEEAAAAAKLAEAKIEADKKAAAERKKTAEKLAADRVKAEESALKQIEQLQIANIEDERSRKAQELQFEFDQKIARITGDSQAEKELKLLLAQELRDALKTQKEEFATEDADKEEEDRLLKRDLDLELAEVEAGEDLEKQNEVLEMRKQQLLDNENITGVEREILNKKYTNEIAKNEERLKEQKIAAQFSFANAAASVLGSLSALAKEGSDEAKVLALAEIAANTGIGLIQGLTIAQKSASATGPGAAFAFPIFYATQLAAVLGAAAQAKSVLAADGMKLEDGGRINGASHAMGGVPFTVDGRGGFEAEGGEVIINKRSVAMFGDVLSDINEAGGGVAFARGGRLTNKFQNGGALPISSGVTTQQQQAQFDAGFEMFAETIVQGFNDKEVINVATNTSDTAQEVNNISAEATF